MAQHQADMQIVISDQRIFEIGYEMRISHPVFLDNWRENFITDMRVHVLSIALSLRAEIVP